MKNVILILCFITTYTCTSAQKINISYEIKNAKAIVPYLLLIDQQRSVFIPKAKCMQNTEDIIPIISSEVIVEKTTNVKIFDKVGKIGVYFMPKVQKLDWEIVDEIKEENGFYLKKALTTFQGKQWVAWFIEEIMISEGPFIFKGLPGLIYSVNSENDEANKIIFQLTEIIEKQELCGLDFSNYKELTEEKYKSTIKSSAEVDSKLLESLMKLDISELSGGDFELLNDKILKSNLLRDLLIQFS
ncbi:GLPGLI family protein [Riemerella anatipestifer]|uniref:GLPGLI family protein n=1 Tax=Riemerella anatipestifer TaxID=34085 RepID=UPI001BDAB4A2|nr:GLPGLI family protein [Riemerella anatipestifer]MBT0551402.1 GLPGLI family protein [Riemerella anatipestifer]MBT0553779.1 GLPGLI family protein [Riemerella anatipestifer]MCE3024161.1 GLPGLI family protein [Riemerella anatipestifer]MCT6745543.1 GLPGLI family protein [Riemerella anatipestifer]MCU7559892.1 GLPGLI family protein [Riemerella anatipestifer]